MVAEILCFKHLAIPVQNALIPIFAFRGKICNIIFQLWSYSGWRGMSFELFNPYPRNGGGGKNTPGAVFAENPIVSNGIKQDSLWSSVYGQFEPIV